MFCFIKLIFGLENVKEHDNPATITCMQPDIVQNLTMEKVKVNEYCPFFLCSSTTSTCTKTKYVPKTTSSAAF